MRCKRVLSFILTVACVAALCCGSFVSSASLFYVDGSAAICPGTTKTYIDEKDYNYAWIDDAVMRDSTTSVVPLEFHPVTDYPYSHTLDEFIDECNNYAVLFDLSNEILQSSIIKTLKTTYYALLASGAIKSNDQEMRAYNESMGITYPYSASGMTHIYTTIVYALLKSDIASQVLKQQVNIPRGTSVEGAVVIYLATVCGMSVPSSVNTIESFAYLFADEYILEESGLPVSDEPTQAEVYYWVKVLAADKQGYEVDKTTPYVQVSSEQEEYVRYAYYASILTSKYDVHVSPELLKQALTSGDRHNEVPRLVLKSMLDDVNTEYSDSDSTEKLFSKARDDGFFELEDDFYSDIYNYEVSVSENSTEVWITAFLVAEQLVDASSDYAKTYINGELVANSSTNCVKLTGDSTVFTVRIEYSDENRSHSAEYKFTVKKDALSDTVGGINIDINQPVGDILGSIENSVTGYLQGGSSSVEDTTGGYSYYAPDTSTGSTTYSISSSPDFSAIGSNFHETYPTDENGNVLVTSDPLATTTQETTKTEAQAVGTGVTQTIKDKPEYIATPIGILAVGASAGYIFFKRRKSIDVTVENADIDDIEDMD